MAIFACHFVTCVGVQSTQTQYWALNSK